MKVFGFGDRVHLKVLGFGDRVDLIVFGFGDRVDLKVLAKYAKTYSTTIAIFYVTNVR